MCYAAVRLQVRYILYKKKLEDVVDVASPAAVGGLGSDLYASLNPQRKMPLLVLPDGLALPESEVSSPQQNTAG
jgi:glutathione S-transferase